MGGLELVHPQSSSEDQGQARGTRVVRRNRSNKPDEVRFRVEINILVVVFRVEIVRVTMRCVFV